MNEVCKPDKGLNFSIDIETMKKAIKFLPAEWRNVLKIECRTDSNSEVAYYLLYDFSDSELRLKIAFKKKYIYIAAIKYRYSIIDLFEILSILYNKKIVYAKLAHQKRFGLSFGKNTIKIPKEIDWIFSDISILHKKKISSKYIDATANIDWRTRIYGEWYFVAKNNLLSKDFYEDYMSIFKVVYNPLQYIDSEKYVCDDTGIDLFLYGRQHCLQIELHITFNEDSTVIHLTKQINITQKDVLSLVKMMLPDGRVNKNGYSFYELPINKDIALIRARQIYKLFAI